MSYKDEAGFSLIATRERQHGHRVLKLPKHSMRVLPIAIFYGENSSGKTGLFKALMYMRSLITEGTKPYEPIPVRPFRLGIDNHNQPSRFEITLLIEDTIYEFSFRVNAEKVLEEKLLQINRKSENVIYHRQEDQDFFLNEQYFQGDSEKYQTFLRFFRQGLRDNELFLRHAVDQNIDQYLKTERFKKIYQWFNNLQLLEPDCQFNKTMISFDKGDPSTELMELCLFKLGTGILKLEGQSIPPEDLPIADTHRKILESQLQEGESAQLSLGMGLHKFVMTKKNRQLYVRKLVTVHKSLAANNVLFEMSQESGGFEVVIQEGDKVLFEMSQESSGVRALIDLLPAFVKSASRQPSVMLIDEVDRNLHPAVARKLVEAYLESCNEDSRSQLLLTSHKEKIDQSIFRRDEMWISSKEYDGSSKIYSLNDWWRIWNE
jgi:AAA15 family ATPase/GTPase